MKYILVPFDFAADLLGYKNQVTAIEIGLESGVNEHVVQQRIRQLVGDRFEVKTRYQQNELIFKTNETEKWVTYMILTFILVIATFNVVGSLTMLIIDKKDDIAILKSMGANERLIKRIFMTEGMLISLLGGLAGIIAGTLLCLVQQYFGLVRLEGVIVEYYPIRLLAGDFIAVLLTVLGIGAVASWLPAKFVMQKYFG